MAPDYQDSRKLFKVGDHIVHPVYGLGYIAQIEDRQFTEKESCQYYKVILPKLTLWFPVETQASIALRLVTPKRELDQYRAVLESRPASLNQKHSQRREELTDRLKESSFRMICEVVRDLTILGWQKSLGRSDAAILQKTRGKLLQEWAASAGISTIEASKEIDTLLQATRLRYSAG